MIPNIVKRCAKPTWISSKYQVQLALAVKIMYHETNLFSNKPVGEAWVEES
jgi:hypothetical protein